MKAGQERTPLAASIRPRLMRRLSSVMTSDSLMSGREKRSVPRLRKMSCAAVRIAVIFAAPGNVKQTKENALRAHADGIVEVSSNAFAHEDGREVYALNFGKYRRDGFDRWCVARGAGVKKRAHGSPRRS